MRSIVYLGKKYKSVKDLADYLGVSVNTLYTRLRRKGARSEEYLEKFKYVLFGEGFNSVKSVLLAYGLESVCITRELPTSSSILEFINFYNRTLPPTQFEGITYRSRIHLSEATGLPVSVIFRCMIVKGLTLDETIDVYYCETTPKAAKGPFKIGMYSFENTLEVSKALNEPYENVYKRFRKEGCLHAIRALIREKKFKPSRRYSRLIYKDFFVYGTKYKSIKHLAATLNVSTDKIYRLLYNHKFSFEEIYDYIILNCSKEDSLYEERIYNV